jgi:hypothetical protein
VLLLWWLKRRRQQTDGPRLAPFVDPEMNAVAYKDQIGWQANSEDEPIGAGPSPSYSRPEAEVETDYSALPEETLTDRPRLPHQFIDPEMSTATHKDQIGWQANSENEPIGTSPSTSYSWQGNEVETDDSALPEETLPVRMRRLEAQLAAVLTVRVPESPPPSYRGSVAE